MDIIDLLYQLSTAYPPLFLALLVFIAITFIFLLVWYAQHVGFDKVRSIVLDGFIRAEKEFEHGDNQQKFEYVVQLARSHLPYPYKLLINEELLRKTIQLWFNLIKKLLDY